MTESLVARARRPAALHAGGRPLVLPTLWDARLARTAVAAGFEALTIGSHPPAGSRGAQDDEGETFAEVVAAVRPIVAAVDVPVSVDLEAGYGQSPPDLIAGPLDAGAVGLNIEDTVHSEGGARAARGNTPATSQGCGQRRIRQACLCGSAAAPTCSGTTAVAGEAVHRLRALVQAGAKSVYPVKIQDNDELITVAVEAVPGPVNCTAHPVRHDLARFARLGVGRITYGPLLQGALTEAMTEMIGPWSR
ncbi:phosphonomutase [Paractinoplanes abujensis]|uniref:2-methylisocitrate lyase-like PEP mutase family enzyme n=1 Tax=Paractinoplanes abujensis TaxID=882441 RepID=A0A7W7CQX5_9ACTN|nr:isocitrate lyase/phosphoenolpyruvate mutase family protein [Actinoplanes abujensis]MBB4693075.1 2-methylisocitrate lyase-like PEP mutase family enzyme [Actinoplanes abujensis]GID24862.1 phosphonomutase [Actinoplanes abujensis]